MEDVMSRLALIENAVCETHQGLLEDCENARKQWNERRVEISELGVRGKGIDNELRCLQARFAKSYAMVRNHVRDCDSCQLASGADHASPVESDAPVVPGFHLSLFSGSHFSHV
jgi:hypothetical protein